MPKSSAKSAQKNLGSSFRDPAGFVYKNDKGEILRQINPSGFDDYRALMDSGLYAELTKKGLLVPHKEISHGKTIIIKPEAIPFISYPFEWSFSQLKDAALLTLKIQKIALKHGCILKDASAYNVQFHKGRPVFIDTLSFEVYTPGQPWQAYRQFCQHFLAPLALMSYTDIDLSQLLRVQIDGIRLDLASKLLPRRAKIKASIAMHIVLHGKAQKAKESEHKQVARKLSMNGLLGILSSLERCTRNMKLPKTTTEWGDYYKNNTNYSSSATDKKAKMVEAFAKPLKAKTGIDLGGNDGSYARVLNKLGVQTISSDIDPNAVESNYIYTKHNKLTNMLPVLVDLTNPGGSIGWANDERESIDKRFNCDVAMALAIIHHLAISNNLPMEKIAEYFTSFGKHLIIEFVPKSDSQVKKLLSTREDIFPTYDEKGFEAAFAKHYKLVKSQKISGTKRTLYLYRRK